MEGLTEQLPAPADKVTVHKVVAPDPVVTATVPVGAGDAPPKPTV